MSPAAALFWVLAGASVFVSMRVQIRAARIRTPAAVRHATSQRKDDKLALVVMLAVISCDETSLLGWLYLKARAVVVDTLGYMPNVAGVVYLLGTVTIAWLVRRSMQRLLIATDRE